MLNNKINATMKENSVVIFERNQVDQGGAMYLSTSSSFSFYNKH